MTDCRPSVREQMAEWEAYWEPRRLTEKDREVLSREFRPEMGRGTRMADAVDRSVAEFEESVKREHPGKAVAVTGHALVEDYDGESVLSPSIDDARWVLWQSLDRQGFHDRDPLRLMVRLTAYHDTYIEAGE